MRCTVNKQSFIYVSQLIKCSECRFFKLCEAVLFSSQSLVSQCGNNYNPKAHHHFQNSSPSVPIHSHMNRVHVIVILSPRLSLDPQSDLCINDSD